MYLITITVNHDLTPEQHEKMFPVHTEWFKKHFAAGSFLMLGPFTDTNAHQGLIFAQTESREALQKILEEDCYYPDFATYEIREFAPKLISEKLPEFAGK
ncbi:YCII-related domain [Kingella potus]|uniref:YCII-related domain n=1 Tax=Kingella potus TaxID=265175 RepID=A0A377R1Z3_9NEIS|nr:YciI family protein [Kingella potus]UOP00416.1 YciI family protein [Kingella potus]STR02516.1 YCII-related domain [Kingella potus]